MNSTVGLIVNPAAGRDIRRLVGFASVMPHHEKAAIVRRVIRGLEAAGVEELLYLPDGVGIISAALDGVRTALRLVPLRVPMEGDARDSTMAARRLDAFLRDYDLLICPATIVPPFPIGRSRSRSSRMSFRRWSARRARSAAGVRTST